MKNITLLKDVKGVTKLVNQKLTEHNIITTYDLVMFLPRKIESFDLEILDYSLHDQVVTVKGTINSIVKLNFFTKVTAVTFSIITNDFKEVKVIAFNQNFLARNLKENMEVYVKGKFNFNKNQIVANKVLTERSYTNLKQVYNLKGINDSTITKIITNIFNDNQIVIYDLLPNKLLYKYNLLSRQEALKNIHLSNDLDLYNQGLKYMKYEEAFLFQKKLSKNINKKVFRNKKEYDLNKVKDFIKTIGFDLTIDQKNAVNDIFRDFKKEEVGYRLIQGDVGSGKTIVAIIAMLGAITANEQVALMAPTELLAKQHYNNILNYFKDININVELLTSDSKQKKQIKERLLNQEIDLIIGTSALIQDDVVFNNLGLIIIDEQHKFGVSTRNDLVKKSDESDLIYLTATPIPRTLAISVFTEADISVIRQKPNDRKIVKTKYINDEKLDIVFKAINETIKRKEKVYIVVPAVTSLHAKYNINNVFELISSKIDSKSIYTLFGKTKKVEQDNIINSFINEDGAILIATTMIEVGIDVKDATLMIIFSADYFGLSQLHQLRGRVGRSNLESMCYLVSTKDNKERLEILEKVDDGFLLSEQDLRLRGPGSLLGLEQSGLNNFKYLDFSKDFQILKDMKDEI